MNNNSWLVLGACALAGCSKSQPVKVPPAVRAEVVAASIGASGSAAYSAVAQATSTVPLAFRGPGYVAELMQVRASDGRPRALGEGDRVRRGDVVAKLRNIEYRDKVNQAIGQVAAARAAAEKARLDFERDTRLYATQSVTKAQLETTTALRDGSAAQLAAAEALLAEARVGLQDTALTAPVDGDIVKKNIEPGSYTSPGMPAFLLADVSRIKVVIGVPDVAIKAVSLGQEVAVTTEALPAQRFVARVSRIAAAADPMTRNFDVEVELPNADRRWKPGMIASVDLGGAAPAGAVSLLPLTAFVGAPGGRDHFAVMVVEGESAQARAKLRPVALGEVIGNRVTVTAGLAAGERVITQGASMVNDGERIEVMPTEEP